MSEFFHISDIYDKNINFLIGSGASCGLFPTLSLDIKGNDESDHTVETLATIFDKKQDKSFITLLFMHYYKSCIEPVMHFELERARVDQEKSIVVENYESFISTILEVLQRRRKEKKCNVFTTNYDGCFTHVADEIIQRGHEDFIVNDGTRGFSKRYLQARNFNSYVCQTGIFDRHHTEIPQINLIHLHGSAYWYQEGDSIRVNYQDNNLLRGIDEALFQKLEEFSKTLNDKTKTINK